MTGIRFTFQDLDLDEAGVHTEMVIEHHDGTTSLILTQEEVFDLAAAARERQRHIAALPPGRHA